MPDYVRVKQAGTGHKLTVTRTHYERFEDGYKLLDEPATDAGGNPLPITYRRSIEDAGRARQPHKKAAQRTEAAEPGQQAEPEGEH